MTWRVLTADCVRAMRWMAPNSVDAVVCDPPYGLHFMGKTWDSFGGPLGRGVGKARGGDRERGGAMKAVEYDFNRNREFQAACEEWATEALRVLKPGGHLLAFGGTRTYHRLASGIEDAGFEVRDCLAWLYGSGFPKSHDVSKAIDKAVGAEREVVETIPDRWAGKGNVLQRATQDEREEAYITAPATPDAERWQGWGTALKPAHEPIIVARKPLAGTVAANVLEHGTGALNIDGTRIGTTKDVPASPSYSYGKHGIYGEGAERSGNGLDPNTGRWPANVLLDAEASAMLDAQAGPRWSGGDTGRAKRGDGSVFGSGTGGEDRTRNPMTHGWGGASRFFYCAKASRRERNAGLDASTNSHPTVKPIELMRWLCRLVTPPGGLVLDPFTGSGTTGVAAVLEGFRFVGLEQDAAYAAIARARIALFSERGEDALEQVRALEAADAKRKAITQAGQLDLLGGDAA